MPDELPARDVVAVTPAVSPVREGVPADGDGPAGTEPARAARYYVELFLFAFAPQAEVLHHLRTVAAPEERERLRDILEQWEHAQARVRKLSRVEKGEADAIRVSKIPPEHAGFLERVTAHPLFQKTFQSHPISFQIVEIDRLVAPQRSVNLSYVQELRARYPRTPSLDDLFAICLWPEREAPPIQHLEAHANTHVFSSPSRDVRFLDSYVKEMTPDDLRFAESGGLPTTGVLSYVGYGCSTINCYRGRRRIVLNNGFHRVYALRSLGVTEIPVLVQHAHNIAVEFPHAIDGLPSWYLLGHTRPVLMKDFFEPGFTLQLRVRERVHVVKVSIHASSYDVLV